MTADLPALEPERRKKPLWLKLFLVGLVLIAAVFIIVKVKDMNTPPESVYTQAEAYAPMEDAAADTVAVLPDFPGFMQRNWAELPCSRNGKVNPDYTNIEIRYMMSVEDSREDRVVGQYVELLRDHWTSLGYEITYEKERTYDDGSVSRSIAAKRDDGITLWYSAAGHAALMIQSGCLPASDPSEIEYVPPVGGIEPGGEGDKLSRYFPDGIPAEETSADAIAPFEEDQAAIDLFGAEYRAREYEL